MTASDLLPEPRVDRQPDQARGVLVLVTQAVNYKGTCGQQGLSLPVRHRRIRPSGMLLKHDSQGGI